MNRSQDSGLIFTSAIDVAATDSTTYINDLAHVSEEGLSNELAGEPGDIVKLTCIENGSIDYHFGADDRADSISFFWQTNHIATLTAQGESLTWITSADGRYVKAVPHNDDVVPKLINADVVHGSYQLTLHQCFKHLLTNTEDSLVFAVGFTVADDEGDIASSRILININDDSPMASITTPNSVKQGGSIHSQWYTSSVPDTPDIKTVRVSGDDTSHARDTAIATGKGVLTVHRNGTWSFLMPEHATGTLGFTIVVTDADGDSAIARAELVINQDGQPLTPDSDGDSSTATLTGSFAPPYAALIVDDNGNSKHSSGLGSDALIGDTGGVDTKFNAATNYNAILMLVASQSMQTLTRFLAFLMRLGQTAISNLRSRVMASLIPKKDMPTWSSP